MWAKVRQLTGKSKSSTDPGGCPEITAEVLNNHYASISSDSAYCQPHIKQTVSSINNPVSEFQMFNVLDKLRHRYWIGQSAGVVPVSRCSSFRSSSRWFDEPFAGQVGGTNAMEKSFHSANTEGQQSSESVGFPANINHASTVESTGVYSD
jgi:hypothetical protein